MINHAKLPSISCSRGFTFFLPVVCCCVFKIVPSFFFFLCKLIGSLEEVHMPQNGINHAGVMALASAMRHNPELRVLNFNDNTFTKRGTLAMAQVRPVLTSSTSAEDL